MSAASASRPAADGQKRTVNIGKEVAASIQRVSALINDISTATAEQSAGVGQVGKAVVHMDQAPQEDAELVEGTAAAAEALRTQTRRCSATCRCRPRASPRGRKRTTSGGHRPGALQLASR